MGWVQFASGKESVLTYLEMQAEPRVGQDGEYALLGDSDGNTVLVIAGHVFRKHDQAASVAPLRIKEGFAVGIDKLKLE